MGLDFRKEVKVGFGGVDPHFSYGGFMGFRIKLAKSINIDLMKMRGFESIFTTKEKGLPWIEEGEPGFNPLEILLSHSDCDGSLEWKECEQIVPILESILNLWEQNGEDKYEVQNGRALLSAMKECVKEEARLIFC
jgi:hypothetical protein